MTRKRKAYRPKRVITNPLIFLCATPPDKRRAKVLRCHTALQEVSCGKAPGPKEWGDLCDTINVPDTLTLQHKKLLADEVIPTLQAATTSMQAACRRFKAGQSLRVDAAGLEALRDALSIYTQVTEQLTEREIATAEADTAIAVARQAKNPRPGVVVMEL